jgi:hypothetical protein
VDELPRQFGSVIMGERIRRHDLRTVVAASGSICAIDGGTKIAGLDLWQRVRIVAHGASALWSVGK